MNESKKKRRRKVAIYNFIVEHRLEFGYSPSTRDIMERMNIDSSSYVWYILDDLAKAHNLFLFPGEA